MKTISLSNIPNQTFEFTSENDRYSVTLNSRNKMTYLSYSVNGSQKILNRLCLDRVAIDDLFMFEDIQGRENPYYDGFNSRFKLRLLN